MLYQAPGIPAMSPKLKPLILPQLVEQRKQLEIYQDSLDGDQTIIYFPPRSSSSSDLASLSPVTPTFSRSGHSRYSGSASSLEQIVPPSCVESPTSPTQHGHSVKTSKSQLPDVQEDPLREAEDGSTSINHDGLYDCLCDEPCIHRSADSIEASGQYFGSDVDYDLGFLSDGDFERSPRSKRRRGASVSTLNGWGKQIGSRFPHFSRLKSVSKRSNPTFTPASEPSLDQRTSLSRAASRAPSSRSSSVSAPAYGAPPSTKGQSLLPTPAMSLYGSTDSIILSPHPDTEDAGFREAVERDRAMTTTPLLPPLLTDVPSSSVAPSLQASPLQSPTVASAEFPPPALEPTASSSQTYPTPPLSSKPSVSSFHPAAGLALGSAVTSPTSEASLSIPNLMMEPDKWSDRLGHANFVIVPQPYRPAMATLEALSAFRVDWDRARVNFTKHLVRTGEHYGTTSNTYVLTQAKWDEIENEWSSHEDDLIRRIVQSGGGHDDELVDSLRKRSQDEVMPAAVSKMLHAESKFPERGDIDIVGPMQRDAVMIRDASEDKKHVSAWLKNLVGKVGLRK
ncbi:hypothetical protein VTK73DRAFT_6927 [Phialemonium thermophilum]|uniref:Only prolin and serin are matching in the corresponding protein n=1 Tax=Phialemonium thermophilum TaxID=223376 RepID=A0ABR3WHQ0_9PEZI